MSVVWFNGEIVEGPIAIDPRDRGFLLGDGIFETLLTFGRTALWRSAHMARMERSAHVLGIRFDAESISTAITQLLAAASEAAHILRLTLTRGAAARGLAGDGADPSLLASLDPFDTSLMFQSARLATSQIRRSTTSTAARLKTLSYIDNIAAAREAAPDDALILNTDGAVASSTIANTFLLKGGDLITPSRDQAILPGIMRQVLLDEAPALGLRPVERPVEPHELATADAVFLTNSLRFIRPVTALDGKPLGTRDLSPLTLRLCELARQQCGRDPRLI